jgi:hypothetical protein
VKQANEHAGDGIVGVAGVSVDQQCLNAGLLDAGPGEPGPVPARRRDSLLRGLEETPVKLGQPKVVEDKGVTHLQYEVERQSYLARSETGAPPLATEASPMSGSPQCEIDSDGLGPVTQPAR